MPKDLITFRVLLDTGAAFEFKASKLTHRTNRMTGKLSEFEYEDAHGDVPRYLDVEHVIGIIRVVPGA